MIKEIMLAGALTFTNNNLFYDLNNNRTYFFRDILSTYINENQTTNVIIDLNNGNSYLADLVVNDNGVIREWEIYNKMYESSIFGDLNISSYINYVYESMGFNDNAFYSYSYLEVMYDLNIENIDFSDSDFNDEVYLDSFFAIYAPDNENVLLQVCDTASIYLNEYSVNSLNNVAYENFALNSLNQDLMLVLTFNNLHMNVENFYSLNFGFEYIFNDTYLEFQIINDIYVDSTQFEQISYSDFIYHDFHSIINDNQNLERDNEILNGIIQDLREENDELNSKHVLSNVFEIVRGSFDGVIDFLQVEIMPNLTIGTLMFIPVVIGVIFFILKALVL